MLFFNPSLRSYLEYYNFLQIYKENDFKDYNGPEVKSQWIPGFKLLRWRPTLQADIENNNHDKEALDGNCYEIFILDKNFTCGLFILIFCCWDNTSALHQDDL